jgi:hypothetical protein
MEVTVVASAILGPALALWLGVLFISAAAAKLVSKGIIDSLSGMQTFCQATSCGQWR